MSDDDDDRTRAATRERLRAAVDDSWTPPIYRPEYPDQEHRRAQENAEYLAERRVESAVAAERARIALAARHFGPDLYLGREFADWVAAGADPAGMPAQYRGCRVGAGIPQAVARVVDRLREMAKTDSACGYKDAALAFYEAAAEIEQCK